MRTELPAEPTDDIGPIVVAIGTTVRRERKRRRLTVESLARVSGVSFGRISELERGIGNPSLNTLQRISRALDLPLPQLFAEPTQDDPVVRADRRHIMADYDAPDARARVRRELLTPRGQTMLQVIRSTVPAGFSNRAAPFRHIGMESVVIEEGVLVVVHGDRTVTLEPGDAMSYRCSVPHYWSNRTRRRTIVLGTFTPLED